MSDTLARLAELVEGSPCPRCAPWPPRRRPVAEARQKPAKRPYSPAAARVILAELEKAVAEYRAKEAELETVERDYVKAKEAFDAVMTELRRELVGEEEPRG